MHTKRLSASKHYPIRRKENIFTMTPNPGAHRKSDCLPLGIIVRDVLGYAEKAKEAKSIISSGKVEIDGRIRKDHRYAVGLMDVIAFPDAGETFRMIPKGGKLQPIEVKKAQAGLKMCKIKSKSYVTGGKMQIGLHDGRTILLGKDAKKYSVGDTVIITLPDQKVKDHIKLEKGVLTMISGGKHRGMIGKIEKIIDVKGSEPNKADIKVGDKTVRTRKSLLFAIGKDKPALEGLI